MGLAEEGAEADAEGYPGYGPDGELEGAEEGGAAGFLLLEAGVVGPGFV